MFFRIKSSELCKSRYTGLVYLGLALVILLRIYESITLNYLFNPPKLWKSEALGLLEDLFLCIGIFWIIFPIYNKLFQQKNQRKLYVFDIFIVILTIGHIIILEYFFYQMEPLDVFVFGHKPSEMMFSLSTSNLSFKRLFFVFIAFITLLILGLYYYKKNQFKTTNFIYLKYFGVLGLFLFFYLDLYGKFPVASDLIKNKSYYFYANILKDRTNKFLDPNINEWAPKYQQEFPGKNYVNTEYPFLHTFENNGNLGNYLSSFNRSPNIIILLTESLSEYFIHPIRGMHFMPFLDSLSKVSLYWPNHLSLGERSFAANPAITASVPYAETGFSLLETYPYHFSLINVLQKNNYFCSFYYGQGAWFHNKKHFYSFNNIDRLLDKNSFDSSRTKVLVGDEQNFWGYNDFELFNQYLSSSDSLKNEKRFDILFTGTSHAPFIIKNPDYYNERFERELSSIKDPIDREHFILYKKFYLSLYNVDDAYRNLFDSLSRRSDFDQTVFLVTGDHAMTELPRNNALQPYKVPLFIYSKKIIHPERFEEVCSQNDIYETLLSYLNKSYQLQIPKYSTALGNKIKFEKNFDQSGTYIFMNNNRQIVDIYSNGYYLYKDKYLFKVYEDLMIREIIDPEILNSLRKKLYTFRAASLKASMLNGLMPDSLFFEFTKQKIYTSSKIDSVISSNSSRLISEVNIPGNTEYIFDLSFEALSESTLFPKIKLEWFDKEQKLIKSDELSYPYEKPNYQFHQNLTSPLEKSDQLTFRVYFQGNNQTNYSFSKLKFLIYDKMKAVSKY
ncbi:MAG: LTA synthase family protein [Saprospiraceae bacterium]